MRYGEIKRKTNETDIFLSINLDGKGKSEIVTDCGFLNHMLTLFAAHSGFDLTVKCVGDSEVDFHHTVEDIGIALGCALKQSLADKRGINRYGSFLLPMDEALVLCALDLSGRSLLCFEAEFEATRVGEFDTELCEEFLLSLCRNAEMTLHIKQLNGKNTHHILEAIFKGLGRALKQAVAIDPNNSQAIPSTKGQL